MRAKTCPSPHDESLVTMDQHHQCQTAERMPGASASTRARQTTSTLPHSTTLCALSAWPRVLGHESISVGPYVRTHLAVEEEKLPPRRDGLRRCRNKLMSGRIEANTNAHLSKVEHIQHWRKKGRRASIHWKHPVACCDNCKKPQEGLLRVYRGQVLPRADIFTIKALGKLRSEPVDRRAHEQIVLGAGAVYARAR